MKGESIIYKYIKKKKSPIGRRSERPIGDLFFFIYLYIILKILIYKMGPDSAKKKLALVLS